jgi:hypothetical protein
MGKGSALRKGHNHELHSKRHDEIDWKSKKPKERKFKVRINGKEV